MKAVNKRALLVMLASLALAGCATNPGLEAALDAPAGLDISQASETMEAAATGGKDTPAPQAEDLLAKARAIAASKGFGGKEDEARARAALSPMAGGAPAAGAGALGAGQPGGDAQAIFQRAALRFAAQGGGEERGDQRSDQRRDQGRDKTSRVMDAERLEANDPREIFRKAQMLARERAQADARAFGSLAQVQAPASNPQTYFLEAMRLRQQQSALALGTLAQ